MGEILLKQVLALGVLLFFGGLMAAVAAVLPRWGDRGEASPEPRGLRLADLGPSAERSRPESPPSPAPPREPGTPPRAPADEEELLAGAVALALALYRQELQPSLQTGTLGSPGTSPWTLAGRWQAMQARLAARKR